MQNEFTEVRTTKTFIDNIVAFYKKNKFLIFLSIFILLFIFLATVFYLHAKEKKIQLTANLYISAKTDLNNNQKAKAKDTLIKIIESNNPTYSTLSLFLLIDANLMDDERKKRFDQLLMLQDPVIIDMFAAPKAVEDPNIRIMVIEILGSDQGLTIE